MSKLRRATTTRYIADNKQFEFTKQDNSGMKIYLHGIPNKIEDFKELKEIIMR